MQISTCKKISQNCWTCNTECMPIEIPGTPLGAREIVGIPLQNVTHSCHPEAFLCCSQLLPANYPAEREAVFGEWWVWGGDALSPWGLKAPPFCSSNSGQGAHPLRMAPFSCSPTPIPHSGAYFGASPTHLQCTFSEKFPF